MEVIRIILEDCDTGVKEELNISQYSSAGDLKDAIAQNKYFGIEYAGDIISIKDNTGNVWKAGNIQLLSNDEHLTITVKDTAISRRQVENINS
jgi:hypothetical protein